MWMKFLKNNKTNDKNSSVAICVVCEKPSHCCCSGGAGEEDWGEASVSWFIGGDDGEKELKQRQETREEVEGG